jgi:hypothetical protein
MLVTLELNGRAVAAEAEPRWLAGGQTLLGVMKLRLGAMA